LEVEDAHHTDKTAHPKVICDHPKAWRPILEVWRPKPAVMETYSVVVWANMGATGFALLPNVIAICMNNFKGILNVFRVISPHPVSPKWTHTLGYSDFHKMMGFTSKKKPNNIL
jgi:hypothetical protein